MKYGFDINEKSEEIPSLGYVAEMNVFERALHDYDFTVEAAARHRQSRPRLEGYWQV